MKKNRLLAQKFNESIGEYVPTYHHMYGVSLFGSNVDRLLNLIESRWGKQVEWIATVNPEFIMNALKDAHFLNILQKRTTVNVIDGVGLIWAQRVKSGNSWFKTGVEILKGQHRESLITGADLMEKLCEVAEEKGRTVFFYGGWEDRSARTAGYFMKKYPNLKVVGYQAEDFDLSTQADYLFVARAMKKQEEWIDANLEKLKVNLVMGVGRSFDYYSGDLERAPNWVRKMGMEWLYSLYKEPKRWRRQLELPKFMFMVLFGK